MSSPIWVLDTGAVMAYAQGDRVVGDTLVEVADAGETVTIPLVCMLEAYSLLPYGAYDVIRILRRHRSVTITDPRFDVDNADDCPFIGSMASAAGRLGAGHAAFVAVAHRAGVVTSRPDQIFAAIGAPWQIREV